jgi:hypothetical protein
MYMERIEVPALDIARPKPKGLKLAAGLLLVLVSAAAMVPWTVAVTLWVAVTGLARAAGKLAAFVHDTLIYAGEAVVGR